MANYIVAGVGVCQAYAKGSTPTLLFTSTTLQEQSMSMSVSAEVR